MTFLRFLRGASKIVLRGNKAYYAWCAFLLVLIGIGAATYIQQMRVGLILTHMRDQVSWAYYIGNFTFLVGIAAAAIMLVIPAYVYHWQPIKEIVILGELLAISAVVMCMLFVTVDMGRPERFWHLIPFLGALHFPGSLLAWDVLVLNFYLALNAVIVSYLLYMLFMDRKPNASLLWPLVIFSIPVAVSIHTVTAFIYNGMIARPYWNASILAPKFLASAFCSGPAVLLILLQLLRRMTRLKIRDEAIWKIAELMAYSMAVNLFLTGAEVYKEFYSAGQDLVYTQYYYLGLGGHRAIVPYAWLAIGCDLVAFIVLLIPAARKNVLLLNAGCVLIYAGVYIEKGIGLLIPGLTPDALGEIYEYRPSVTEVLITAGIFSVGFLLFTIMVKIAVPIMLGEFKVSQVRPEKQAAAGDPLPNVPAQI